MLAVASVSCITTSAEADEEALGLVTASLDGVPPGSRLRRADPLPSAASLELPAELFSPAFERSATRLTKGSRFALSMAFHFLISEAAVSMGSNLVPNLAFSDSKKSMLGKGSNVLSKFEFAFKMIKAKSKSPCTQFVQFACLLDFQ